MLQPLEVTIDAEFFLNLIYFFGVLKSFEGQHGRVRIDINLLLQVSVLLLVFALHDFQQLC